jgi:hypothetical protein
MKTTLLTALLLVGFAWAGPAEEARDLLLKHRQVSGLTARIEAFSAEFLGLPYGSGGPLGEGVDGRYDQDPLYRFDTFDCTTYVETVLSLARSSGLDQFERRMDEIRYENAVVDYVTRNHFPSLDWIPNNIRNGLFQDPTVELTPPAVLREARATIDKPTYYSFMKADMLRVSGLSPTEREERAQEWRQEGARFRPEVATLNYVPINWVVANPSWTQNLASGMVVNFVRPNWDLRHLIGTHMNVSHQGFVIRRGSQLYLRHASTSGKVSEVLLLDYLRPFVNHATLKGVHFLSPQ